MIDEIRFSIFAVSSLSSKNAPLLVRISFTSRDEPTLERANLFLDNSINLSHSSSLNTFPNTTIRGSSNFEIICISLSSVIIAFPL
ncbi:Uncharacterised protein [Streptococcus pneumoniae]|nr:Uncharacterised protein [Streptococcus pneumoniae]